MTGCASVMKNVPPGATKWATTRAHAAMSGSQFEHAAGRVDDVEPAVEHVRQVVQVRLDEARLGEPELVGQRPRQLDRRGRQVGAGHARPEPAHESVSIPKWHWRCRSVLPVTSPIISISYGRSRHAAGLEPLEVVEPRPQRGWPSRRPRATGWPRSTRRRPGSRRAHRSDQAKMTSGARSASRQKATTRPARSRIQGFSSRGSSPISSSTRRSSVRRWRRCRGP